MSTHFARFCLLAAAALPLSAQFNLYVLNGNVEQPTASVYSLGAVDPGASASVPFRIRNTSSSAATLAFLTVNGTGFALSSAASFPLSLAAQQSIDFSVIFQSAGAGSYSAAVESVGISLLLTASVPVELTCQTGGGVLTSAGIDFGTVERGSAATRHVTLMNQTMASLYVPVLAANGAGFQILNAPPAGTLLTPTESVGFDVQFSPAADGAQTGVLAIGNRTYPLRGAGSEPALPAPRLSVALAQPQSAQQGSITINLDAASKAGGTGSVTIAFQPSVSGAADSQIALATGGQTARFTVSPGDTQGSFNGQTSLGFQTGTTAGTLTISVELGGQSDRRSFTIAPAPVTITAAQGLTFSGGIEVDLTGFDNTRTAGQLTFTFYDAAGNALAPGAIHADATSVFTNYFQNATGGAFELRGKFPVTGDNSQIKAFEATLTNSAGTTQAARTNF